MYQEKDCVVDSAETLLRAFKRWRLNFSQQIDECPEYG